jgi:hypothetical protein
VNEDVDFLLHGRRKSCYKCHHLQSDYGRAVPASLMVHSFGVPVSTPLFHRFVLSLLTSSAWLAESLLLVLRKSALRVFGLAEVTSSFF